MNNFFDNKANTVDWVFNKHNKVDIKTMGSDEIQERLSRAVGYKKSLYEILELKGDEKTKNKIISIVGFISVATNELRSRGLKSNVELLRKNHNLQMELKSLQNVTIPNLKKKNKKISEELKKLQSINQVEKTKRHEMSLKSDMYVVEYLKTYIKNMVSEQEYADILYDLNGIKQEKAPN